MLKFTVARFLADQELDCGSCVLCFSVFLMIAMALLRSGVVAKLLDAMRDDNPSPRKDDGKPVLLQIRSIIPVLEEGDLWPNRGFYLKVSDRSHAIYVSLPQEENDLILSNKLKLGQFIHVQKLEKSDPVPLLRGITPIPGRRLCEGSPEDMNSPRTLAKFLHSIDADAMVEEKGVISEKKIDETLADSRKLSRGLSAADALVRNNGGLQPRIRGRSRSVSATKTRLGMNSIGSHSIIRPTYTEDDSDSDSTLSSVSSVSKRKSWTQSEILELKEIFDSSVSPVRSVRYDSSEEYSTSTTSGRNVRSIRKSSKAANNIKTLVPKVISEQTSHPLSSLIHDRKGAEAEIAWGTLPAVLLKLGKEVVRQRDAALSTAADALQEACAAERLLKSLSKYSELNASEGGDSQPYIDKFIDLQDDLGRTKLIMQSLTNISPFTTSETDPSGLHSVKQALDTAVERKKNATSWIKSAVALDLSTSSADYLNPSATRVAAPNSLRKSSRSIKPKAPSIIRKQRSIDEIPHFLVSDKDNHAEWIKGNGLSAATDLANSLQDECRKLFLDYLEKYLEKFDSNTSSIQSDSEIAGMMFEVKRINDLLVSLVGKEPNCNNLDDSEKEAYARAREKICGILLNNVDRTAWLCSKSANSSTYSSI
ncbi:OLC1v1002911C2 [Oldenlandia corymbosa var. corymbosa]|uniref:OLC1v1002911C2 n=1 Tax=Oldenlandia corymbosa var. corymbosa TaxID=529605 RepID=A0AAV1D8U7_OLDCO|nr:OLC1v1002911C2 [Oldenlandia corymbosa var. corymbosa]